MTIARIGLVALVTAAFAANIGAATAEPAGCAPASVTVEIPAQRPFLDYAENFAFDSGGNLWVSRLQRNVVEQYDPAGTLIGAVPVDHPGAARMGPDGLLYVVFGNTAENALPGAPDGGVVRFDPADPAPEVFVSGLGEANGAAFDAAGNLYVADMFAGIVRFRPDGSRDEAWSEQARHVVVNGVAVSGDAVYVTMTFSPTGQVLRIPIDDPARYSVAAEVGLAPDEVAALPDGTLYVATQTGRLVHADPVTGTSCAVWTGEPLAAVVAVPGTSEAVVGTSLGNVLHVR